MNSYPIRFQFIYIFLGMRLLHIAVLREKHEIIEHLAITFPNQIDLTDTVIAASSSPYPT